jgi:hypothetical protein
MKKIFALLLVLAMMCGLCACASAPCVPEDAEYIGYVIIPHADGEEHADIYDYYTHNGTVSVHCMDGRFITSPRLIVVLEP